MQTSTIEMLRIEQKVTYNRLYNLILPLKFVIRFWQNFCIVSSLVAFKESEVLATITPDSKSQDEGIEGIEVASKNENA